VIENIRDIYKPVTEHQDLVVAVIVVALLGIWDWAAKMTQGRIAAEEAKAQQDREPTISVAELTTGGAARSSTTAASPTRSP
jgi:hypothetical protein